MGFQIYSNSLVFSLGRILNINTIYLNIILFDIHLDKITIMGQQVRPHCDK